MARFTRARVRALLRRGDAKQIAQGVARILGVKPASVLRQLYHYTKGSRSLSEKYISALENVLSVSENALLVRSLSENLGSLRAASRHLADVTGLKESTVRRQLQRVLRGERDLPEEYRAAFDEAKQRGERQARVRDRLSYLLESGHYTLSNLAKSLGVSSQKLQAVLRGQASLSSSVIKKIDRRYRYRTKEAKRPRRRPTLDRYFRLPPDAPDWARPVEGNPGDLYRYYAMYWVNVAPGNEYQKIIMSGYITRLLSPGLPGNTPRETLLEMASQAMIEIEDELGVTRGVEASATLLYIFRHYAPQPRL